MLSDVLNLFCKQIAKLQHSGKNAGRPLAVEIK